MIRLRHLLPFLLLCLTACSSDAPGVDPYRFQQPEHFPPPAYNFTNNPITEPGFRLGKRLFNDLRLSRDGSVSCATCHQQAVAFADPQHRISVGIDNLEGKRNAPGLFNLAFTSEFMWDGGIVHLDFVPINAITAPFEMDETLENVLTKVKNDPTYPAQFREAFGQDTITSGLLLQALSQYQLLLVSDRSKYDDVALGRNDATFTLTEQRGFELFKVNCATCHSGQLFTDGSYRNNGLEGDNPRDIGRELISESPLDRAKFRVPTLRNIARTPPYMHDGRFDDLREVLAHYRNGVQQSPTLDPTLSNGIPLTDQDVEDVIEFLHTLTDWELIMDARF